MTLDFTRGRKARQPLSRRQWVVVVACGVFATVTFYLLAVTTIVLNGTTSLPHNAYVMVSWPKIVRPGLYVAFDAPEDVSATFNDLVFVKQIVATSGDAVLSSTHRVCAGEACRDLLPEMIAAGYDAPPSHVIPDGKIAVFGDAADSLDSRYAAIGDVDLRRVVAVGIPINIPPWEELGTWLGTF